MKDKQKERDDLILTLNGALKDVIGYVPLDSVIRLADILIEKGVIAPSEDLINRQKAEIERLSELERGCHVTGYKNIRAEAITEFEERCARRFPSFVGIFDQIAKELKEGVNNEG